MTNPPPIPTDPPAPPVLDTRLYAPAAGSAERAAWDRLSDDGRRIVAAWHDDAGDAADRLNASAERPTILRALGY